MGPRSALWYLESRQVLQSLRRMVREPRYLLPVLGGLVFLALLLAHHPGTPDVMRFIRPWIPDLAHALVFGLILRLGFPLVPLYFVEPADLMYLVPATVPPPLLMARRTWHSLQLNGRLLMSIVLGTIWITHSLALFGLALLYVLVADQVGVLSYRLKRWQIPVAPLAWVLALLYGLWAAAPTVARVGTISASGVHLASDPVSGLWIGVASGESGAVLMTIAGLVLLAGFNVGLAPSIGDIDWAEAIRKIRLRMVRRGDVASGERNLVAGRLARRGDGTVRPWNFVGRGSLVLAEVKVLVTVRRLVNFRVGLLMVPLAIVVGFAATRFGPHLLAGFLVFALYIMLMISMVPTQYSTMLAGSWLVGLPRTAAVIWAEETGSFLTATGFWLLAWTAAWAGGMPGPLVRTGYLVLLAAGAITSALRIHLWTWFPEANIRTMAGRFLGFLAGLLGYGIAGAWLAVLGMTWGPWAALATAVGEATLLNWWTGQRITVSAGRARVYGTE